MIYFNMLFKLKLRGVLKELPLASDNLLFNQLNISDGFKMNFKRYRQNINISNALKSDIYDI